MRKFIKRVTAEACPVHRDVIKECIKRLVEKGYFNKNSVLVATKFGAMEDSISWKHIANILRDPDGDYNVELVGLAQKFFSSTRAERLREAGGVDKNGNMMNLGPYLAGGHGKRTAGYATVTFEGGLLALKRAQRLNNKSNGVKASSAKFNAEVLKHKDNLEPSVVASLEDMSNQTPLKAIGNAR